MTSLERFAQQQAGALRTKIETMDDKTKPRRLAVQAFSETPEEEPQWLWEHYLLLRSTSVLGGKQGSGKGMAGCDIVARLSRGDVMPDGSGGARSYRILIVTREDDPSMALKPRLRAAGADMTAVLWTRGDFEDGTPATMQADIASIETAVVENSIDLVVIDPLGAWIEDDSNSASQVRAVIDPLNRLAARTGCAVLLVAHLRKAPSDDPMDSFAGSFAVTAAVRTAIVSAHINETERMWSVVKTNFKRPEIPLVWSLVEAPGCSVPRVQWRRAGVVDTAAAAVKARGGAPIVPGSIVLKHLKAEHRSINLEVRRIHKAIMGSFPRATVQSVKDAIDDLVEAGKAHEGRVGNSRTVGLMPAREADTGTARAMAAWRADPTATVREIAERAGCSKTLAAQMKALALSTHACPPADEGTGGQVDKAGGQDSSSTCPPTSAPYRGARVDSGQDVDADWKNRQHLAAWVSVAQCESINRRLGADPTPEALARYHRRLAVVHARLTRLHRMTGDQQYEDLATMIDPSRLEVQG